MSKNYLKFGENEKDEFLITKTIPKRSSFARGSWKKTNFNVHGVIRCYLSILTTRFNTKEKA